MLDPNAKTEFMKSMAAALGAVQDISEQAGSMAKARLELSQWQDCYFFLNLKKSVIYNRELTQEITRAQFQAAECMYPEISC